MMSENSVEELEQADKFVFSEQIVLKNFSVEARLGCHNLENLVEKQEVSRIRNILIGQDLERKRMAQDLHDAFGQELHAIRFFVCALEKMEYEKKKSREFIHSIKLMVDKTIMTLKEISLDLMPSSLQQQGLKKTILQLISHQNLLHSNLITYELNFSENSFLTPGEKVFVYRIIQEFISNSIRHSQAENIHIVINGKRTCLQVHIMDNGIGFDLEQETNSSGLNNIRERLLALKASYQFVSDSSNGTKLNFEIHEK